MSFRDTDICNTPMGAVMMECSREASITGEVFSPSPMETNMREPF